MLLIIRIFKFRIKKKKLSCIFQEAFVTTFDNANTYSSMLSRMLSFYQENESVDIANLKAEKHGKVTL